jgi:RNA-directed DNA polymerase
MMMMIKAQKAKQLDNACAQDNLSVAQSENEKSKSILDLTYDEAHKYFLKHESYCSFDLPEYFKFEVLLNSIDTELKKDEKLDKKTPRDYEDVNYKVLNNKDGKYAWRPLQRDRPEKCVLRIRF